MRYLLLFVLLVGMAAGVGEDMCSVDLDTVITPSGSDANVVATYKIDCLNENYLGQVNKVQFQIVEKKDITVSDSSGPLLAGIDDPDYYKITDKIAYSLVTIRPRRAILIAPYGDEQSLTISYKVKDVVLESNNIATLKPVDTVVHPKITLQIGNTETAVETTVQNYNVKVALSEGFELKEATKPCTIDEGTLDCPLDAGSISELSVEWREKPLQEKIVQEGWPWAAAGIKSYFSKLFGSIL